MYIKTFESYSSYKEISIEVFSELQVFNLPIKFSSNEVSAIGEYGKVNVINRGSTIMLSGDNINIGIIKIPDDWYIVHIMYNDESYRCFKCDQFYGLKNCIQDVYKEV